MNIITRVPKRPINAVYHVKYLNEGLKNISKLDKLLLYPVLAENSYSEPKLNKCNNSLRKNRKL